MASGLHAEVELTSYKTLPYGMIETFEDHFQPVDGRKNLPVGFVGKGLYISERFVGQTRTAGRFDNDKLNGPAHAPLELQSGGFMQNVFIRHAKGFDSTVISGVGHRGIDHKHGRGEGAVSLLFENPQCFVGLRIHAGFRQKSPLGEIEFQFFDENGRSIALIRYQILAQQSDVGFKCVGTSFIKGITITTTDPGGASYDDIKYDAIALMG